MTSCCASCRLLQDAGPTCIECGGQSLVDPRTLTTQVVHGVTALAKRPATGWRDNLALTGTIVGAIVAAVAAGVLIGGAAAPVAYLGALLFGYSKQYWRAALRRRPRMLAIAAPTPPSDEVAIEGVVQAHDRRIGGGAVAIATTYLLGNAVVARQVEAVPFWLIAGERRILVTGAVRIKSPTPEPATRSKTLRDLGTLGFVLARDERTQIAATIVALLPGDRIAVIGAVEPRPQFEGAYRDDMVETVSGEVGRPVWITVAPKRIVE